MVLVTTFERGGNAIWYIVSSMTLGLLSPAKLVHMPAQLYNTQMITLISVLHGECSLKSVQFCLHNTFKTMTPVLLLL
jgi:hypothetical protein